MDCFDCGCYAGSLPLCRIPVQASYGKDEVNAILSITKKAPSLHAVETRDFLFFFFKWAFRIPFLGMLLVIAQQTESHT